MKKRMCALLAGACLLSGCGDYGPASTSAVSVYDNAIITINTSSGQLITSVTGSDAPDPSIVQFRRVSSTLWVADRELTRLQWRNIMGTAPWEAVQGVGVGSTEADPAANLSFEDARVFAVKIGQRAGVSVALPTVAEYRALSSSQYPWGDTFDSASPSIAKETRQSDGPQAVGTRSAQKTGFYDLTGNLREWASEEVLVGGSWADYGRISTRTTTWDGVDPSARHPLSGVRLVIRQP